MYTALTPRPPPTNVHHLHFGGSRISASTCRLAKMNGIQQLKVVEPSLSDPPRAAHQPEWITKTTADPPQDGPVGFLWVFFCRFFFCVFPSFRVFGNHWKILISIDEAIVIQMLPILIILILSLSGRDDLISTWIPVESLFTAGSWSRGSEVSGSAKVFPDRGRLSSPCEARIQEAQRRSATVSWMHHVRMFEATAPSCLRSSHNVRASFAL